MTVAGWGRLEPNLKNLTYPKLQKLELSYLPNQQCLQKWMKVGEFEGKQIHKSVFCSTCMSGRSPYHGIVNLVKYQKVIGLGQISGLAEYPAIFIIWPDTGYFNYPAGYQIFQLSGYQLSS